MMRSLTFDQGKMYSSIFSLYYKFIVKFFLKTPYVINAFMFQVYFVKIS